ncbi:MAG: MFS transporter [Anaerolineae bacterium]|nr:MFS transporter [Anaerolineae bacterium]MDW8101509.1 MFS transporter [Anaerolineae bacterium]
MGFLEAFKIRDFRILWIGQFISQIGDSLALIAALVVIQKLSGSTLWLGFTAMAIAFPPLLLGLVGGVMADRFDRKKVMIISDILRGIAILFLIGARSPQQLYLFPLVGCFMSIAGVFFGPARNAVIPSIVSREMLLTANGLLQASQMLAIIVGSSLASLIIATLGPASAFILDSLTFFLSAWLIFTLKIPPVNNSTPREGIIWPQLKEGLGYIKKKRPILIIMVAASVATLSLGSIAVLGVAYVEKYLGVSAESFGFLNSIQGVGMVIGGLSLGFFSRFASPHYLAGTAMIALGAAIISFAFSSRFEMALILATLIGVCVVVARATLAALLQATVPNEKRGRVESTVNTSISFSTTLAMGLSGLLGAAMDVRTVFILAALGVISAGILTLTALKESLS